MGCHFLLQGIFPAQESNPWLLWFLHCSQILYCWAAWEAPDVPGWPKTRVRSAVLCSKPLRDPPGPGEHPTSYPQVQFLHINQHTFLILLILKKMKVKVPQSCLTLCDPMGYTVPGILQARILEWAAFPFPGDLPNPRIEPRSPSLQADSLPTEPQGKPKNTGVGSVSLLQRLFLTQESNRGLLHYRQILYQLSYQGSILGLKRRKPVLRLKCVKYKYLLVIVLSCLSAAKVVLACLLSSSAWRHFLFIWHVKAFGVCNICYRYFSSIALYLHLFVILEYREALHFQIFKSVILWWYLPWEG